MGGYVSNEPDLRQVVNGGYCVGCGACAALDPTITMEFDDMQRLQAVLPSSRVKRAAAAACPFADGLPNEDALAHTLFTDAAIVEDTRIGRHLAVFGGWVEEGEFRARASSGGIGTWLQGELLACGLVDAVINVTQADGNAEAPLFRFAVAKTREEVSSNAKTRYYPVEMSGVIRHILQNPGRYALIGVPCFVKALRLAAQAEPILAERLHFVLGIVCGHLKSAAFADAVAWQCGVRPDQLTNIDFRTKLKGRPASRYGATVEGIRDGEAIAVTRPMEGLVGANWGHGLFKLKACEFCDDVLAETADAVVGDAWLPMYDGDHRGTNVVVVRHPKLRILLESGAADGRLRLDPLSADQVAASQAGGLRHRRDGLAYRLMLTDSQRKWRPTKRVAPGQEHLSPNMRRIHRLRFELGQKSHAAFRRARSNGDWEDFLAVIAPLVDAYERDMRPSVWRRAMNYAHRKVLKLAAGVRRAALPEGRKEIL